MRRLALPLLAVLLAPSVFAAERFEPTWESLKRYQVPEWFRDAKFGIWAHWGPQCQPEQGDWYARFMYVQKPPDWGKGAYEFHNRTYGHPSVFGFKDVIHTWKADRWDPDALMALYKRAGAQYFFALANHHDNLDLWNSKHQPWNSVRVGPKKDIIGGWARAAREQGLRFGVSVHAAHAWTWYEVTQGADTDGDKAGVPYDGRLTAADGKGTWWEGLDPQDLYAQNHARSANADDPVALHGQWEWGNGASLPDAAYLKKFLDRTVDLIEQHRPDLIYFDDTVLPFHPVSDVGLEIAAHFYNRRMEWNGGRNDGVLFGKILDAEQRKALVWDVERGAPNDIQPLPWQTCTCIGSWHYRRSLFEDHGYKSANTVLQTLADNVSKNGNLLLSIPVRGDGTIDSDEIAIVEGIAAWMDVNRESIFGTRPWKVFGEGPSLARAKAMRDQGFNEGTLYAPGDIRFTVKDNSLYVIALVAPEGAMDVVSLGVDAKLLDRPIARIEQLGHAGPLTWSLKGDALHVTPVPAGLAEAPVVFRITLR